MSTITITGFTSARAERPHGLTLIERHGAGFTSARAERPGQPSLFDAA